MTLRSPLIVPSLALVLAACGGDGANTSSTSSGTSSGSGGDATTTTTTTTTTSGSGGSGGSEGSGGSTSASGGGGAGGSSCQRLPGPADVDRFVVVGHPNKAGGGTATDYEVLSLSQAGVLAKTGTHFSMGESADRPIVFTPDGKLGFAVQRDGTIGAFRINMDGTVDVLDKGITGTSFYATGAVMSEAGDHLLVVDPDFPAAGGGIYRIDIGCDDSLTAPTLVMETKSAGDLAFVSGNDAIVAAKDVNGSGPMDTVARVTFADPPTFGGSVDAFGDDQAIVSWVTLTHDRKFSLIGDYSIVTSPMNRVAFVELTAQGLAPGGVLPDIEDPFAIAASPFDDAAIVVSGFGDAIIVLDYKPATKPAFSVRGELVYKTSGPQLPGALVMVQRGSLNGHVLIADVRGVYQVAFAAGGVVNDLDVFDLGGMDENIVSGIGVQP